MSLINQFRSVITKTLVNLGPVEQSKPSQARQDRPRGNLFAKSSGGNALAIVGPPQNSDALNALLAGLQNSFAEVN
jgi:hypothetical protein